MAKGEFLGEFEHLVPLALVRGGRAKRLFELAAVGRTALAGTQEALRRMREGLDEPPARGDAS